MWQRLLQGVVIGLIVVMATVAVFVVGGMAVLVYQHCQRLPAAVTTTAAGPTTSSSMTSSTADPTLKAIEALGNKIDSNRHEDNRRFALIDERLKRLEGNGTMPQPEPPCGDHWTVEVIPPHQ